MQWFLSYILSLFLLMLVIAFTFLRIYIDFKRDGKNDLLQIQVKAWFGLIHTKYTVPISQIAQDFSGTEVEYEIETPQKSLDNQKKKIRLADIFRLQHIVYQRLKEVRNLLPIFKKFLRTIRLEKFEWRSIIGTSDAAETGILTGVIWGIKSTLMGFLSSYFTLRQVPRLYVQPNFQQKRLETKLKCMIRFRLGNAMVGGIRLLLNLRKRRDEKWQSTQFRA